VGQLRSEVLLNVFCVDGNYWLWEPRGRPEPIVAAPRELPRYLVAKQTVLPCRVVFDSPGIKDDSGL
jgi:hypothetical protein